MRVVPEVVPSLMWRSWNGAAAAHGRKNIQVKTPQRKSLDVVAEWKHGRLTLVKATFKPLLLDGAMNSCSFIKGYRSGLPSGCIPTQVCGRLSVSRWTFSYSFFVLLASCLLMDSFPTGKPIICFVCLFCASGLNCCSTFRSGCAGSPERESEPEDSACRACGHLKMHFGASGKMCGSFFFFSPVFPSNYLFFFTSKSTSG